MSKAQSAAAAVEEGGEEKLYRDEDWFRARFIDEGMGLYEIREVYGYPISTLSGWMQRHGIDADERDLYSHDIGGEPTFYNWAFKLKRGGHRLEAFKEIRESVEGLPVTKTTFKLKDVIDEDTLSRSSIAIEEMLKYLGCWPSPDRYDTGDRRASMWVNGNAKWAPTYSDVAAVCDGCGAVHYHPYFRNGHSGDNFEDSMGEPCDEDCPLETGEAVSEEIWDNRKRIIREAAKYAHQTGDVARRMDVTTDGVIEAAKRLGYDDWQSLREYGLRCRRETWVKLNDEYDVYYKDLAEAFGVCQATVCDHVNRNKDMYED